MNEITNCFLLAGDKCMVEAFKTYSTYSAYSTFSACGPFTRNK